MILNGVVVATTSNTSTQLRTIRERFFYLTQAHGLALLDAADLMRDYGFTPSVFGSTDRLLDLMTPKVVAHLGNTFHVQPEWLSAASDSAIPSGRSWYKHVHPLGRELIAHLEADLKPEVILIRRARADFDRAGQASDAITTHRTNQSASSFDYGDPLAARIHTFRSRLRALELSSCRYDVKMLIAFCEQLGIGVDGRELSDEALAALRDSRQLPVTVLNRAGYAMWQPEDYASFRFEVTKETNEWLGREGYGGVRDAYLKSGLGKLVEVHGGPGRTGLLELR